MDVKPHRFECRVGFADTDASGWVHFTKTLVFVERAEHELLRSLNIPIFGKDGGWPRVHVDCDYTLPLKFNDEIVVEIHLSKLKAASLAWNFKITKDAGASVATGTIVTVKVNHEGRPTLISDFEKQQLGAFLQ